MKQISALLLTTLIASPLAMAQDDTDEGAEEVPGEERACVNIRAVRTFDAIDDQHIYIREGSDGHFLLTMQHRCFNLRNSLGIGFRDTTGRSCSKGFGEIVYRDRMGGGRGIQSCRIDTIERVESKDDAVAIVDARKEADN